jgi:hypothetical protein
MQALETTERVIARLTLDPDRGEAISRLIAAIERDRAELLAAMIGGHARRQEPRRIRTPSNKPGAWSAAFLGNPKAWAG